MIDAPFEPLARLGGEFAIATRAQRRRTLAPGSSRFARPAMASIVVVVAAGALAVAPVRGALEDLGDTLAGYFDAEDPPGRPVEPADSPPAWLDAEGYTGQRVIASSGPYSLYLAHRPGGDYSFGLDDTVGIGDSRAGWERQFADNAVIVLGPGTRPDSRGRVPLYGVTAGNVAEVELRYVGGATTTAPADTGGFVLMLDGSAQPAELIARTANGEVVQTINAFKYGTASARSSERERPPRSRGDREIVVPENAEPVE
jgi:hypothetical protein